MLGLAKVVLVASGLIAQATAAFNLPLRTSGRDILDSAGNKVVYKGVNWPGAADAMIPEGLQYQSISTIVSKIKSLGMNAVRLTYATQMVDDIYAKSSNSQLSNSLNNALGTTNGPKILAQITKNNPSITGSTTRLQVFDAVAAELAKQGIYVHLDNHISKGKWCCNTGDGNTWFADTEFPAYNWQRAWGYMAAHAKSWTSFASVGLRNELRQPQTSGNNALPYDWKDWYENMVPAAEIVYHNNSSPLIFFSGLGFDTDCTALVNKQHLGGGYYFNPSSFDFANKVVIELHNYQTGASQCSDISGNLNYNGYNAMDVNNGNYYHVPILLTEFGFYQQDNTYQSVYAQCIKSFITGQPGGPGGWFQWVIAGSYYIREGTQDYDETWGLFNHDWSNWRNADAAAYTKSFAQASQ